MSGNTRHPAGYEEDLVQRWIDLLRIRLRGIEQDLEMGEDLWKSDAVQVVSEARELAKAMSAYMGD